MDAGCIVEFPSMTGYARSRVLSMLGRDEDFLVSEVNHKGGVVTLYYQRENFPNILGIARKIMGYDMRMYFFVRERNMGRFFRFDGNKFSEDVCCTCDELFEQFCLEDILTKVQACRRKRLSEVEFS